MINWEKLEEHLKINYFYEIDNNKSKNIVLFGNCHCLPIVYYLNNLLDNEYNFIVIISWYYQTTFDKNELEDITSKIKNIINKCDILIMQKHCSSFEINASKIDEYVNDQCKIIIIPNFILDYLSSKSNILNNDLEEMKLIYNNSLLILCKSINESDFPNFLFIKNNINDITFFNTIYHPTHYVLYLLSKNIFYKIKKLNNNISLNDYWDNKTREEFYNINLDGFVFLPGKHNMSEIHYKVTNISFGRDYFDISF
jgi:hypothetical protein